MCVCVCARSCVGERAGVSVCVGVRVERKGALREGREQCLTCLALIGLSANHCQTSSRKNTRHEWVCVSGGVCVGGRVGGLGGGVWVVCG